jgi:hypothetical protein
MAKVRITGKERFRRQLERLGDALADDLKPILERNARELEAAIRVDVPVGATEDLSETLTAYEITDSQGLAWRVVEGSRREGGGKAFYATFQEFGTLGGPAQPHFFFNFRRLRGRFRSRISRAVKKAVLRNFQNGS